MSDYHIMEIGTLPGGMSSHASAVNNSGEVVGWGDTTVGGSQVEHALYRDPKTGALTDLHITAPKMFDGQDSQALDINELGQAVGWARIADGQQRGFMWSGGVMQALGVLPYAGPGPYNVLANAINDFGWVVGISSERKDDVPLGPEGHAFLWFGPFLDLLYDLNDDLGKPSFSIAQDINDSGNIVGAAGFPESAIPSAFLWPPSPGQSGDLNPGGTFPGEASAISDRGLVVGDMASQKGDEATVWFPYFPFLYLSAYLFGPQGPISEALDVNSSFQVVGQAQFVAGATFRAFLYESDGLADLNTKIDDSANWELLSAVGISKSGEFIVGNGTYKGNQRGFILKRIVSRPSIPRETPIDILAGGRLDTGGVGLHEGHVVPIPIGPDPFRRGFREVLESLAAFQISFRMGNSEGRRAFQEKVIGALKRAVNNLVQSVR